MFQLRVIVASTRPGRKGRMVADWFVAEAGQHPSFEIKVLDLAEINLPIFDEPEHPRFRKYTKQHDYLSQEWKYKPVGFVSYGGTSGGTRAVQMGKMLMTTFSMMPLQQAVSIPFFEQYLSEAGEFLGTEKHQAAAKTMLDELAKWTPALKTMRP